MIIIRAFQAIKRDGIHSISTTYNEVDESGDIIRENVKDSFMAIDSALTAHIEAIEDYVLEHRLSGE